MSTPISTAGENKRYKLSTWPGFLHQRTASLSDGELVVWLEGTVNTEHGIVRVYCQFGSCEYTLMEFARGDFVYHRRFEKAYSARRLRTLAKRFATEVAMEGV